MTYQESRSEIDFSKVFQRGKTQIPVDVRRQFNIKDNDKLLWISENGKLVVEVRKNVKTKKTLDKERKGI